MADLYGLEASGLPPEFIAKLQGLKQQQAIAQALLEQSMQAPQPGAVKGRFQGSVHPLEYLSKIVQGQVARGQLGDVDKGRADVALQQKQRVAQAMMGLQGDMASQPFPEALAKRFAAGDADALPPAFTALQSDIYKQGVNREDQQTFLKAQAEEAREARKHEKALQYEQEIAKIRVAKEEGRISAEQAYKREADLKEYMLRLGASLRAPPAVQPLVAIVGPDGKPTYVQREEAIGKQPVGNYGRGMSATAQKELIQTEEEIQGGKAAKVLFAKLKEISPTAYGGFGSGAIATAGSILPDVVRPGGVDKTLELDNMVGEAALPQLKALFGGMPTEGERQILLDVSGSSKKPHKVREGIYARALAAIDARIRTGEAKAKALREGRYFSGEPATGKDTDLRFDAQGNLLP